MKFVKLFVCLAAISLLFSGISFAEKKGDESKAQTQEAGKAKHEAEKVEKEKQEREKHVAKVNERAACLEKDIAKMKECLAKEDCRDKQAMQNLIGKKEAMLVKVKEFAQNAAKGDREACRKVETELRDMEGDCEIAQREVHLNGEIIRAKDLAAKMPENKDAQEHLKKLEENKKAILECIKQKFELEKKMRELEKERDRLSKTTCVIELDAQKKKMMEEIEKDK